MPPAINKGAVLRARYRIVQVLHQSRHANIYLAEDQHLSGRVWAVREMQLLAIDNFEKNRIMSQFHAEALRLSQLDHPVLAKVVDFFVDGNNLYIVREYVHGTDLGQLLGSRAIPLAERESLQIISAILDAIAYIQGRKLPAVFFRELTAQNVVVAPGGVVKLLDLGLASIFQAGDAESQQRMGSMDYAAPEQFSETPSFDQRTLVYTLGAMLYHMLTRRNPAQSPFALEAIEDINPRTAPGVAQLVHRATEIDPRDRYPTLLDFKKAIQAALKSPSAPAPKARKERPQPQETWDPEPQGPLESASWNWVLGLFMLLVMSGGILAIYYYFLRP